MKTVKIVSMTLLMSILCAGVSFAGQQGQRDHKSKATSEERSSKRIEKMKETLNLTPEQVTKLEAIQAQCAKDKEQKRQDIKAKKEAYDAQVKSILTPEQYKKYQEQNKGMKKGKDRKGKWNKDSGKKKGDS